jgi:hypothetical protein
MYHDKLISEGQRVREMREKQTQQRHDISAIPALIKLFDLRSDERFSKPFEKKSRISESLQTSRWEMVEQKIDEGFRNQRSDREYESGSL